METLCRWTSNELTQRIARECGGRSICYSCLLICFFFFVRWLCVATGWLKAICVRRASSKSTTTKTSSTAAQLADDSRSRRIRHSSIRTQKHQHQITHWNSRINAAHKIKQVCIRFVLPTSFAIHFNILCVRKSPFISGKHLTHSKHVLALYACDAENNTNWLRTFGEMIFDLSIFVPDTLQSHKNDWQSQSKEKKNERKKKLSKFVGVWFPFRQFVELVRL